jgi:hypothetical protein
MTFKLTTWDKIRNGLGLGYSKKTEAAIDALAKAELLKLKELANARIKAEHEATLAREAAEADKKAKAAKAAKIKSITPPAAPEKKPAAKKVVAKPAAPKTPAAKKPTPKKPSK